MEVGAETVSGSEEVFEEPRFDFDCTYSYGRFRAPIPPLNRHFVPRLAKLKAHGGESISFYQKWRAMQYDMNKVMVQFLNNVKVNASFLPPVKSYEMWLNPKAAANYDTGVDPCPDCDVRFHEDQSKPVLADTSILVKDRWSRRLYNDSVILIGLPDHITCGFLHETGSSYTLEYFDPAGKDGDRANIKKLRKWAQEILPKRLKKRVRFIQSQPLLNFQSDQHDCMCQTWIWFWVYFRVVRRFTHKQIAAKVKIMIEQKESLINIHIFNSWLHDLLRLGCFMDETPSQDQIVAGNTPLYNPNDNNNNK
jgi:hypothetical protein